MRWTGLRIRFIVLIASIVLSMVVVGTAAGESPVIDSVMSMEQVTALANDGNAKAMLELGERLVEGKGVTQKVDEGMKWLQKAADAGINTAWYDLGYIYSNAVGVKMDMIEAMKYFRKGAEVGNADCQASMGLLYQAGERIPGGVKADVVEAMKWYQMAAAQNHTEAIQHLAMIYWMGQGVEANADEAVKWFRKGAELGNGDCIWGLGQCYLSGNGVALDTVTAYALFSASLDGVNVPDQKKAMTERRDELGKGLTPAQIAKAEPIIKEWQAKVK